MTSNQNTVSVSSDDTPYFMPWASRIVLTIERPMPVPMVLFGDRGSGVFDGETDRFSGLFQGDGDEFALRGVIDRVVEEIPENLTQL